MIIMGLLQKSKKVVNNLYVNNSLKTIWLQNLFISVC